jgi:hypothetical protein
MPARDYAHDFGERRRHATRKHLDPPTAGPGHYQPWILSDTFQGIRRKRSARRWGSTGRSGRSRRLRRIFLGLV